MPIYEYWCKSCRKRVEILTFRIGADEGVTCPKCGGAELRRLVSRFVSLKSEESRLESLADPSNLSGLDDKDPASMARWLKKMGRELGEDIGGDEIDQMAEEIASGKGLDEGPSPGGGDGSSDDL